MIANMMLAMFTALDLPICPHTLPYILAPIRTSVSFFSSPLVNDSYSLTKSAISVVTWNLCGYGFGSCVSFSFLIARDRISKYCLGSSCASSSSAFLRLVGCAGAFAAFSAFLAAVSRALVRRLTVLLFQRMW